MGTKPRRRPKRLADKLLRIRTGLGLTQAELVERLGVGDIITYNKISEYESGRREPVLEILLAYGRAAGVCVDVLIDDELELPAKLPAKPKHTH
jgi:transcriptional regulator with XRE-family HTH domain